MNYFSQLLKSGPQDSSSPAEDSLEGFQTSWSYIHNTLLHPDERQLTRGIESTNVPAHLKSMVDSLVLESARTEEGTAGICLEYLLRNDVLGTLVRLSETDRPAGIQAAVLRSVSNMVVLLNEQFLVHTAVHRPVLRLLRSCVGDELEESYDGQIRTMGAAGNAVKPQPSQYEEDLVELLCTLCSRIRTYRDLLMIFFYDKHLFQLHSSASAEEVEEAEGEIGDLEYGTNTRSGDHLEPSPTSSELTITSPQPPVPRKPEYEFLLFNYLLRFVHREGRIGDFARAGMLFLMDVAMSADEPAHKLDGEHSPIPEHVHPDPVRDAALAFAEYILEGDFAEVLGAGLSAVYSLLPSKLWLTSDNSASTLSPSIMIIGSQEPSADVGAADLPGIGIEDSSSKDFRARLDHFLKMVEFIQDVLRRNVLNNKHINEIFSSSASAQLGAAIVKAVTTAVKTVFLENILYPSILECSDLDGSSVAVMSYLQAMLASLSDGSLASTVLQFLMVEDDESLSAHLHVQDESTRTDTPSQQDTVSATSKIRRRKSSAMMLLEIEAPDARKKSQYLKDFGRFTLKDLIVANVKSPRPQSVSAACQLFVTLLRYHCSKSVGHMIGVAYVHDATGFSIDHSLGDGHSADPRSIETRPHSDDDDKFIYPGSLLGPNQSTQKVPSVPLLVHLREMELYLNLVPKTDPADQADVFSTGYSNYVQDALLEILDQTCYANTIQDPSCLHSLHGHRFSESDPLLQSLLHSLCGFFSHSPDCNISLTGALSALALCPYRDLTGFLTFTFPKDASGISAEDLYLAPAKIGESHRPVIHVVLRDLVTQVERYRATIENFDLHLQERRKGLLFSEQLLDALDPSFDNAVHHTPQKASLEREQPSSEPPALRPKKLTTSSIMSFLTPTKKSSQSKAKVSTPERSVQRQDVAAAASPFGKHYHTTKSVEIEPFHARMPLGGPWAERSIASSGWPDDEDDVFISHMKWDGGFSNRRETSGSESKVESDTRTHARQPITLSQLLDNVVILEEFVKELAGIIAARRSLGIDIVDYT